MLVVPVNVAIVVIVTENFKKEMKKELSQALEIVESMINQVKNRRMVKISEIFKGTLVEHISEEAKKQTKEEFKSTEKNTQRKFEDEFKLEYLSILKRNLEKELEHIDKLKIGDEILLKTITGMTLVQLGINIKEALSTIVLKVKDWEVVSISNVSLDSELLKKRMMESPETE